MAEDEAPKPAKRNPDGTFAEGHSGYLKHGGEGAIKRLEHGSPLEGIAAELKRRVHEEIDEQGIVAVMRERAERHQAVADLFYGLLLGTTEAEPLDRLVRRFGWMNSKAFAMLRDIAAMEETSDDGAIDYEHILQRHRERGEEADD